MKSFKRALLISLILHISLLGFLSFRFPERKKPSLVRVRLVSISQAGLHTLSPPVSSRKSTKPTSPPKKEPPSPPKTPASKPKKKPQKKKSRPQSIAEISKPKPSSGKKGSVSFPSKVTPREEERLRERLAALQLKQKLEKLREKVASEKGEGEGVGAPSQNYSDLARAHLHQFFEVPLSLKSQKNLAAIVEIRVGASGKLLSYRLIKSSGNTLLDRVAEATVRAADPYPPPGKPITIKAIFTPQGFKQLVDF